MTHDFIIQRFFSFLPTLVFFFSPSFMLHLWHHFNPVESFTISLDKRQFLPRRRLRFAIAYDFFCEAIAVKVRQNTNGFLSDRKRKTFALANIFCEGLKGYTNWPFFQDVYSLYFLAAY